MKEAGEEAQYFRLDGSASTLVFASMDQAVPQLFYWGPRIEAATPLSAIGLLRERPLSFASLEQEAPLSLCPEESRGFSGSAALQFHRDGRGFTQRLELRRVEQGADHLKFHLADPRAGIELTLHLHYSGAEDLLSASTSIKNVGEQLLTLDQIACPTLPLEPHCVEALLLQGRWAGEFQSERVPLYAAAALVIEQHVGRSGPEHFPGCILGEKNFGETSGHLLGLHLACSGNYRIRIERLADGRAYVQAAEYFHPGEMQLPPGAIYTTPQLIATQAHGLELMSQRFHAYLRRHILPSWTRHPRPVLANSWEAVYFDHRPERLSSLVKAAAAVGAERFVLDDGWFRARRHDRAGLGDWQVDEEVYPKGLSPLIAEVHAQGMSFGLWVEPEMVSPDSDLFRTHPEWVLQTPGYPLVTGRHQLLLNLSEPGAFSYVKDCLLKLLETYPIAYLKWDMNRVQVMAADRAGKAAAHRQLHSVYLLMEQISEAHPELEIESCASGGGRADFEILRRCGRIWTSDNNDPLARLAIHEGFSLFFPAEVMGAHIGGEKAHITGRKADIHLRATVALQGQLGFEVDLSLLAEADSEILRAYTRFYKEQRSWIAESKIYRLSQREDTMKTLGYVSSDRQKSLWWISSRGSLKATIPDVLKLRGLCPQTVYRLRLENLNRDDLTRFMQRAPAALLDAKGILVSGELLMLHGFSLPVLAPESVMLFTCHAES